MLNCFARRRGPKHDLEQSHLSPRAEHDNVSSRLPPELWKLIFVYAAVGSCPRCSDGYFRPSHRGNSGFILEREFSRPQLKVKSSLVRVCKLWRVLALPLLYEIVWIENPHMARCFHHTLVSSASRNSPAGYGQWVRRIVLLVFRSYNGWKGFQINDIINRCPNIELLSNPTGLIEENRQFWNVPNTPPLRQLTSLRHLYWTCTDTVEREDIDAVRLSEVILSAPNVSYLSIIHYKRPIAGFSSRIREANNFSALTKLYFESIYTAAPPFVVCDADMPNLVDVLAPAKSLNFSHPTDPLCPSFLSVLGKRLQIIELLDMSCRCITTSNDIVAILHHCPNLHTFIYQAENTVLPPGNTILHTSLSVVRLGIPYRSILRHVWDELERCLQMHFAALAGKAFPALRRVVFQGYWHWTLDDPQLRPLYSMLQERGLSLEGEDGTVITPSL